MGEGEVIALIAGQGRFPAVLAQAVKARGLRLVSISFEGENADLARVADYSYQVEFAQIQLMLKILGDHRVRRILLAGQAPRARLIAGGDAAFRGWTAGLGDRRDYSLFIQGLQRLEQLGIAVASPLEFVGHLLTPPGVLTIRQPTAEEWDDIRLGMTLAREAALLDIGQTVVLKRGVILAVEAAEGTDETIRRGGGMDVGTVVTKAARPGQDDRFDVPTVGRQTIDTLGAVHAAVLALEAGRTLLLDRDEMVAAANGADIAIVGVELPEHSGSGVRGQGSEPPGSGVRGQGSGR